MHLQQCDALVIVDVQRDFLSGGALAVPDADSIIPVLNKYLSVFRAAKLPIVATRDWHPPNHCSFTAQGGMWPPHCVQNSLGAEFSERLKIDQRVALVSKATEPDAEAYSGFDGTGLESYLSEAGVDRLFIGGLATDYCVSATVQDAIQAGFRVVVLSDAIRAVGIAADDEENALAAMRQAGAVMIDLKTLDANG